HQEVKDHICNLIDEPALLLSCHVSYVTATLDGQPWECEAVIIAIQKHSPQLPHLEAIMLAFLRGTLETWERFASEFAPGGLIDLANTSEREEAWMPSTNDANEGALLSYRQAIRHMPRLTGLVYNSQAMVRRNDTEAFMHSKFGPEDYAFVREWARNSDASKLEASMRRAQAEFDQRVVQMKQAR
ncbi:hypothetical protein FOMPIDRAFT_1086051, partial [Fomitopsis schrenkii]